MDNTLENYLSISLVAKQLKEKGVSRDALLQFLCNDLGYLKDIHTITELGLQNGVTYRYKEDDPSQRWPVYSPDLQINLEGQVDLIIKNYGYTSPITEPKKRKKSVSTTRKCAPGQPEKIPVGEYPEFPIHNAADFTSFVAYDFETTGLDSNRDAIIEIGAIKVINGVICEEKKFCFQEFVKPYKKAVSEEITKLTGIRKEDVANARPIWEVTKDFADFIGDLILVGFNNVRFDSKFLVRAGRISNTIMTNRQFDVMSYAVRNKNTLNLTSCTLDAVSKRLGIVNTDAHRALADAITTAKVYMALYNQNYR